MIINEFSVLQAKRYLLSDDSINTLINEYLPNDDRILCVSKSQIIKYQSYPMVIKYFSLEVIRYL